MTTPVELTIDALVAGGDGLARHEGRAVFVPLVVPGDRVRAAALRDERGILRADGVELLARSPDRIEPPCPLVGTCGGCQWQQASYEAQLRAKEGIVRDALRRIGRLSEDAVRPIVASPEPFRYRRRMRAQMVKGGWGFAKKGTHQVVPVPACLLVEERVETVANEVAAALKKVGGFGAIRGFSVDTLETGAAALHLDLAEVSMALAGRITKLLPLVRGLKGIITTGEKGKPLHISDPVLVDAGHFGLRVRPDLFAQANRLGTRLLARSVADSIQPGASVLELFAGAGTLTLALESRAGDLTVSEGEGPSLELLRMSLGERSRKARFEPGDAAKVAAKLAREGLRFDHVVLDPPRAGAREAMDHVAALTDRVTYVSCDPATFARDAAQLVARGLRLVEVTPFDLFPQTHHVEVAAVFAR